ncbi:hypothetical protein D3C71_1675740 [compost metagenome]
MGGQGTENQLNGSLVFPDRVADIAVDIRHLAADLGARVVCRHLLHHFLNALFTRIEPGQVKIADRHF